MRNKIIRLIIVIVPLFLCIIMVLPHQMTEIKQDSIYISEICAKNLSGYTSRNGERSDWIEIYNPTDFDISLDGWGLSKKNSNLKQWSFPDIIISSKSYLLIFANSDIRQNDEMNCGFGLDAEGGSLFLSDNENQVVDAICYPRQIWDVTYGRTIDYTDKYFAIATPGKQNIDFLGYKYAKSAQNNTEVEYSFDSGNYPEPIKLELKTNDSGEGTIVYTLDGSTPSLDATIYRNPIDIELDYGEMIVVRAAVFKNNCIGKVTSNSYYNFSDTKSMSTLSLAVDPDDFWGFQDGIYNGGALSATAEQYNINNPLIGNFLLNESRAANLELMGANGWNEAGSIKISGETSRAFKSQKAMTFEFENPREINGHIYNEIRLRPSCSSETFSGFPSDSYIQCVASNLDVGAKEVSFVKLYINGEYWGIYSLQGNDDASYWKRSFQVDVSDIVNIKYATNPFMFKMAGPYAKVEYGNADDLEAYNDLYEKVLNSDLSKSESYEWICSQIDIENFTQYIIVETFFGNYDWPWHNVSMWKTKNSCKGNKDYYDGKWRWIIYDMDYAFAVEPSENSINLILNEGSEELGNVFLTELLFQKLWRNDSYRKYFLETYAEILDAELSSKRLVEEYDRIVEVIDANISNEIEATQRISVYNFEGGESDLALDSWSETRMNLRQYLIDRHCAMRTTVEQLLEDV